ncbi:MAG: AmmeMemoRadiSam system protein B [Deltaproteobacteria bacterium]|nr:AmmeMemoRadiSam system protein B [Deltaproteobacteria bacterium]
MKSHRKAAVAGRFYPSNPKILSQEVKSFIDRSKHRTAYPVKFLIVPHAGYIYSGKTAGEAYAEITQNNYKKIVLLGPSHRYHFEGIAESGLSYWDTPLGSSEVLVLNSPHILKEQRYHQLEHSLEVQLPFLQYLKSGIALIPLLLSGNHQSAEEIASTLLQLDDKDTLWVISSDFNHTGPDFGHIPDQFGYKDGREMDLQAIKIIERGDIQVFRSFLEQTRSTICGALPILVAMLLIQSLSLRPFVFKKYDCSANMTGDIHSVGYGALYS